MIRCLLGLVLVLIGVVICQSQHQTGGSGVSLLEEGIKDVGAIKNKIKAENPVDIYALVLLILTCIIVIGKCIFTATKYYLGRKENSEEQVKGVATTPADAPNIGDSKRRRRDIDWDRRKVVLNSNSKEDSVGLIPANENRRYPISLFKKGTPNYKEPKKPFYDIYEAERYKRAQARTLEKHRTRPISQSISVTNSTLIDEVALDRGMLNFDDKKVGKSSKKAPGDEAKK